MHASFRLSAIPYWIGSGYNAVVGSELGKATIIRITVTDATPPKIALFSAPDIRTHARPNTPPRQRKLGCVNTSHHAPVMRWSSWSARGCHAFEEYRMRKLSSALLASCLIAAPLLAHGAPAAAPAPTPAAAPAPAKPPISTSEGYLKAGQAELQRLLANKPNDNKARNVILFIGDGMGVSTLTAGRIFEGQQLGLDGESYVAQMDRLPHTALVKTYSHDAQVPDSAPTATAIVAGIKTKNGVIGVGPG